MLTVWFPDSSYRNVTVQFERRDFPQTLPHYFILPDQLTAGTRFKSKESHLSGYVHNSR